jgi:hypothetical protein
VRGFSCRELRGERATTECRDQSESSCGEKRAKLWKKQRRNDRRGHGWRIDKHQVEGGSNP